MFSGHLTFERTQNIKIGSTRTTEKKVSVGLYAHQGKTHRKITKQKSKLQEQLHYSDCILKKVYKQ